MSELYSQCLDIVLRKQIIWIKYLGELLKFRFFIWLLLY